MKWTISYTLTSTEPSTIAFFEACLTFADRNRDEHFETMSFPCGQSKTERQRWATHSAAVPRYLFFYVIHVKKNLCYLVGNIRMAFENRFFCWTWNLFLELFSGSTPTCGGSTIFHNEMSSFLAHSWRLNRQCPHLQAVEFTISCRAPFRARTNHNELRTKLTFNGRNIN